MSDKNQAQAAATATRTIRLSSTERIALQHMVSAPKPWDGQRADAIPAVRSALARLLSLGLVRSRIGEEILGGLQDDTPLWVTPAGREALARATDKTKA